MTDRASVAEVVAGQPARRCYLAILALFGFVTSFGAHIVATNLPAYAWRLEIRYSAWRPNLQSLILDAKETYESLRE